MAYRRQHGPVRPIEFNRQVDEIRLDPAGNRVQLEDENGNPINAANPIPIGGAASTGVLQARSTPAAGFPAANQLVLADGNRTAISICNFSDAVIAYCWGANDPTVSDYDFRLTPGQVWTLGLPWAAFELRGISTAAGKQMSIREVIG